MNIIITGASSGVGYATALQLAAAKNNRVFALARQTDKLNLLASQVTEGEIIPVVSDLVSFEYGALSNQLEKHGITHIDILVHNAGLLIAKPFGELSLTDWEMIYKVNVFGVVGLTRMLLPFLGGEVHSHIVNISSIGGVNRSQKFPGLTAYSSSKGALCTLTECLAAEFQDSNISVNCLALGSVQTEMLTKAFPGYAARMTPDALSGFICDFATTGWQFFNGKILEVSTTNP